MSRESARVQPARDLLHGGVNRPWNWGGTQTEVVAAYPCDQWTTGPAMGLTRAVDVNASPELVFRWLCQLRAAPYSYDWIDNLGRRSPQKLTVGLDRIELGQPFLIARVVSFEHGHHLTGAAQERPEKLFGVLALTYQITPRSPGGSRLVVRLNVENRPSPWRGARRTTLAWGDLVMMRRQLLNLKALAERDAGMHGTAT